MYNILTCLFLVLFGIGGGLLVSKYSGYCELKYELNERNPHSLKRTIIITVITTLLMLVDFFVFLDYESPALNWTVASFSLVMVYMIVIDFETMYILDRTHIAIALLAVLMFIFKLTVAEDDPLTSLSDGLIGLLVGGGLFFIIALIANPIAQKKYGEDVQALGYGDVKLMAACGFFVGWKLILVSILIASFVGVIVQLIIKGIMKKEDVNFAFGPYLAIGILISLYFGNQLIDIYLNIIG